LAHTRLNDVSEVDFLYKFGRNVRLLERVFESDDAELWSCEGFERAVY
jgi:hypothetical protein